MQCTTDLKDPPIYPDYNLRSFRAAIAKSYQAMNDLRVIRDDQPLARVDVIQIVDAVG